MMVLVAVAIGTGFVYSVAATFFIAGDVFYEAAAFLATFVLLGHWFEMRARGGANDAIRALLDLAPPKAVVIRDDEEVEVATAEVVVGDLLLIRPGTKIAVDAEVVEGDSSVDESMVTGESLPVSKHPGDKLIGATINKQGTLRARATAVGSDTALAQIVKLVQEAQNSKAPAQRLADRAAFWLVLVALIGGVGTFAVWLGLGESVTGALLFAITVVVITCPDALGLATPTAIMVGTGLGAKRGILFKNAIALEQVGVTRHRRARQDRHAHQGRARGRRDRHRKTASTSASCCGSSAPSSARASIRLRRRSCVPHGTRTGAAARAGVRGRRRTRCRRHGRGPSALGRQRAAARTRACLTRRPFTASRKSSPAKVRRSCMSPRRTAPSV